MSEEKESPLDVEEVAEKEEVLSVLPIEPGPEKKKEDVRKRLLKKAGKKVIKAAALTSTMQDRANKTRKKKARVTQLQVDQKLAARAEKARLAAELKGHHIVCTECRGLIDTVRQFAEENKINHEKEFIEIMKNASDALAATNQALSRAKRLTGWKRDDIMNKIPAMLIKLRKDILIVAQWLRVHKRRLAIITAEETDKRNHVGHDNLVAQINSNNKKKRNHNKHRYNGKNNVNINSFDDGIEVVDEKGRLFGSVSPISTPSTPGQHNFTAHSTPDHTKHQVPDHSQDHFDDFFSSIKDHHTNENNKKYDYDVNEITSSTLPMTIPDYDVDVPKSLMMTEEHLAKHYKTPEPPKGGSHILHQFTNSPRVMHHLKHGTIGHQNKKKSRTKIVRCPLCTLKIPCEHFASVEKIPLKLLHESKRNHAVMEDQHYTHNIQATVVLCSIKGKGTHLLKYIEGHLGFLKRCLIFTFVEGALNQLLTAKLPHCVNMSYEQIIKTITTSKPNLLVIFRSTSINNRALSINKVRNVDQIDEILRLAERHNTPFAANESSASIMIQHIAASWD